MPGFSQRLVQQCLLYLRPDQGMIFAINSRKVATNANIVYQLVRCERRHSL